jgi:hypothetical protein
MKKVKFLMKDDDNVHDDDSNDGDASDDNDVY